MKLQTLKPNLKVYAAPVALLMMAGILATPNASADPAPGHHTVQAQFRYNADAPADQIYAKLRKTAERMCAKPGLRPLAFRKADAACVDSAMQDGVSRIGRTDIAALHSHSAG